MFIAIGAFVFANLVVAVVVTNLVSECCFSTLIYFYYEGAQFLLHISPWVCTTVEALVFGHPRDENMLSARPQNGSHMRPLEVQKLDCSLRELAQLQINTGNAKQKPVC